MATPRICSAQDCIKPARSSNGFCAAHYVRWKRYGNPLGSKPRQLTPGQRYYLDIVLAYEGQDCLFWPFGRFADGYGQVMFSGKKHRVSRLVCEHVNGPPPTANFQAAHSCGNGHLACVAKSHLEWKTHAGNMVDMVDHGTSTRGERHNMAKLTEADIRSIRSLRGRLPQFKVAARFGISKAQASRIQNGKNWGWLK
jgi:hypothetical protein